MSEHEILQKLAGAARWDMPPAINVADEVMRSIAGARRRSFDPAVGYFAAATSIAAAIVGAVAVELWINWQDPLLDMVSSMTGMN
ncbi:MAG: hypothetical protein WC869_07280 [Phycisphaerae bacterium]|jgi:hypothetical protein